MDAAVFVLTSDPPVSASERELITMVAELSVAMFVVLNKADRLSDSELAEVVDFTAGIAANAAGRPVRIYPVLGPRCAGRAVTIPGSPRSKSLYRVPGTGANGRPAAVRARARTSSRVHAPG